ncbi:MAG: hypothetical protein ABIR15_08105 [Chitinophagaceae bacterium]
MKVLYNPRKIFKTLCIFIAALVICAAAIKLLYHYYKTNGIATLDLIFNLDKEHNIPSLYSFAQLVVAAVLLVIIALHASGKKLRSAKSWWLMAFLFFYIAADELESIHERVDRFLRQNFHTTGFLHFSWIIPAVIILLILGIILLKFVAGLPAISRKRFLIAGTIYIIGAVGGDAVGGEYISIHGNGLGWPYVLEYHIEETMEMFGIACFIYALLQHIKDNISDKIIFKSE